MSLSTSQSSNTRWRYISKTLTLQLDSDKCNACGMCMEVCPHEVFVRGENAKAVFNDRDACMECGACKKNCAKKAISVRSGVGCAAGVINGILKGKDEACCDDSSGGCC